MVPDLQIEAQNLDHSTSDTSPVKKNNRGKSNNKEHDSTQVSNTSKLLQNPFPIMYGQQEPAQEQLSPFKIDALPEDMFMSAENSRPVTVQQKQILSGGKTIGQPIDLDELPEEQDTNLTQQQAP